MKERNKLKLKATKIVVYERPASDVANSRKDSCNLHFFNKTLVVTRGTAKLSKKDFPVKQFY